MIWYQLTLVCAVAVLAVLGQNRVAALQDQALNGTEAYYYVFVDGAESNHAGSRRATAPYGYRDGSATTTNSCQHVRGVPAALRSASHMKPKGLDNFYQKYTEAYGIPVLSSKNVPDDALKRACYILRFLLAGHEGIRKSFYRMSGRMAVIGKDEGTVDIPEHSHLDVWYNERSRGLGATPNAPVSSGGEENVLCYSKDRYPSEDIYLHEASHAVHNLGANYAIPGWDGRLRDAYNHAKSVGLWKNTYSMSTYQEYFAEGAQSYFNVNDYRATTNGIHGPISTRDKLRTYDPTLYNLIREVYPCDNNKYLKRCESTRAKEDAQKLEMNCQGPTPLDSGCIDDNINCPDWANNNECTKNPNYMKVNCKKSCNICSRNNCLDLNKDCFYWAKTGECGANPNYMNINCKKSCNRC